jgi:hypothetical protein
MHRFITLLILFSFSMAALGQELIIDDWEDLNTKSTYRDMINWDLLNPDGKLEVVKESGGLAVRLSEGMKLRSHGVSPYVEAFSIQVHMAIPDGKSAGGIGLIDFKSGIYFYLYADREKNELVLQRGDGLTTHQLYRQDFDPGSDTHLYQLDVKIPENKQPLFTVRVDDQTLTEDAADPSTLELGSTYQLYLGVGNESIVDIYKTNRDQGSQKPPG